MGNRSVKIPILLSMVFARPTDIEVYNVEKDEYIDTTYHFSGATCGNVKKMFRKSAEIKGRRF